MNKYFIPYFVYLL